MEHHVTAIYGVSLAVWYQAISTQCYLLPDTSERTPPSPQLVRLVLDLPTPKV